MSEWKEYKIGDICRIKHGFAFKGIHFVDEPQKYVCVTPGNFALKGGFKNDKPKYYNGPIPEDYVLQKDDLVVTMTDLSKNGDTLGYSALIPYDEHYTFLHNQRIGLIEDISNEIDKHFLYWVMRTYDYQRYIVGHCSGSTVKHTSPSGIGSYIFRSPNMKMQKEISSVLDNLDDKIEVNRKINENLEQQAQALFKSWLKKCEDEVTIGDLSLNITDYTKCEQKQVVLINSSDVTEGRFEHHNLSENKNLKGHFKKRFQKGDILYSQVRPRNRHWGYCTFNADNYLASTQLMVIRNRPDVISSILLYQYIIENKVWMDFTLRTETRSGTFPQGNYEDLSAIKVPFGADVKEITDNLENIYSLIYKNEDESRRLAELRDTLLPKLMSGELKVNEVEECI